MYTKRDYLVVKPLLEIGHGLYLALLVSYIVV